MKDMPVTNEWSNLVFEDIFQRLEQGSWLNYIVTRITGSLLGSTALLLDGISHTFHAVIKAIAALAMGFFSTLFDVFDWDNAEMIFDQFFDYNGISSANHLYQSFLCYAAITPTFFISIFSPASSLQLLRDHHLINCGKDNPFYSKPLWRRFLPNGVENLLQSKIIKVALPTILLLSMQPLTHAYDVLFEPEFWTFLT